MPPLSDTTNSTLSTLSSSTATAAPSWLPTLSSLSSRIDVINVLYQLSPVAQVRLFSDRRHLPWRSSATLSPILPIGSLLAGLQSAHSWLAARADHSIEETCRQAAQAEIQLTNTDADSGATRTVQNVFLADIYSRFSRAGGGAGKGVGVVTVSLDTDVRPRRAARILSPLVAATQAGLVAACWRRESALAWAGFLALWAAWALGLVLSRLLRVATPLRSTPAHLAQHTRYTLHRGMNTRVVVAVRVPARADGAHPCLETLASGTPYSARLPPRLLAALAVAEALLIAAALQLIRQDDVANLVLLVCGTTSVAYEHFVQALAGYGVRVDAAYVREECMLHALARAAALTGARDIDWAGEVVLPNRKRFAREAEVVRALLGAETPGALPVPSTQTGNWKVDRLPEVVARARRDGEDARREVLTRRNTDAMKELQRPAGAQTGGGAWRAVVAPLVRGTRRVFLPLVLVSAMFGFSSLVL